MKITSVLNIKGGVGKSLTAEMIGRSYAKRGVKTLLVDADGQGNLSQQILGSRYDLNIKSTLAEFLKGEVDVKDCIWETEIENLYIIPATLNLYEVIYQLQGVGGADFILGKKLQGLDFERIIIDNEPTINKMTYNAIYCADEILCPTSIGTKAIGGVQLTNKVIAQSLDNLPYMKPIKFTILLTMITRNNNNKKGEQDLRDAFGDKIMKTKIRFQQKPVQDAENSQCKSLLDLNSGVSEDYKAMFEELLEREGK